MNLVEQAGRYCHIAEMERKKGKTKKFNALWGTYAASEVHSVNYDRNTDVLRTYTSSLLQDAPAGFAFVGGRTN